MHNLIFFFFARAKETLPSFALNTERSFKGLWLKLKLIVYLYEFHFE